MKSEFRSGMAEVFEVEQDQLTGAYALTDANWNSLAIVSAIALADEVYGVLLSGRALAQCKTFGDVVALIEKTPAQK